MKQLLIVIAIIASTTCFSQKDSIVASYEGIVQMDSLTSSKLFAQAKIVSHSKLFDRFKIFERLEEESASTIVYKIEYRSMFALLKSGTIRLDFTLQFKDGKYRYKVDNMHYFEQGLSNEVGFSMEKGLEGKSLQKSWDLVQQGNALTIRGFLRDFNAQMHESNSW